jgi:hypothetical protein
MTTRTANRTRGRWIFRWDEPMKIYPVSNLVNSPKTDDPRCIEPVRIDRDFFERQWWGNG